MKKLVVILFLLNIVTSCKSQDAREDYIGNWSEVQQQNNEFVKIDCGYKAENIKTLKDSIFEKGTMEDVNFKIDHVKQNESGTTIFIDNLEKSSYRFTWVDKEKGICKWEITINEISKGTKYYINSLNLKNIIIIKGTKKDCITNDDIGDKINDSLVIENGNKIKIEDDNCLTIETKKENLLFERCFENCIVKIRHNVKIGIPLTIINGQNSMDIDFYSKGNNWNSNTITYYRSSLKGEDKIIKSINISIKDFDFDKIVEQFPILKNADQTSLSDIKNKEKLMQLDVYKISDILKSNPISTENIDTYNNAATNLIEGENFNEARIILLEIVNFSPNLATSYLNLGDAQWGFEENEEAKKSYKKYIALVKSQGTDLNNIPKRVYERIK